MDSMMDALFAATLDRSPHTHRTPIGSDGDAPHVHRTRTRASIPLSCLIPDFPRCGTPGPPSVWRWCCAVWQ